MIPQVLGQPFVGSVRLGRIRQPVSSGTIVGDCCTRRTIT